MKPKLYMFAGLPGTGKSTYAKLHFPYHPFVYSTDKLIDDACSLFGMTYSEGFDLFYKPSLKQMNRLLSVAKDMSMDVIWDQTNLNAKSRANKVRGFDNYHKELLLFDTPDNHREILDGRAPYKVITEEVLQQMKQSDTGVQQSDYEIFDNIYLVDAFGAGIYKRLK